MTGAIDIGGTKIAIGIVDRDGHIRQKVELPTDVPAGFDHAMRRVRAALSDCARQAGVELSGIGVGCAGEVDAAIGMLRNVNNLPGWEGCNPVEVLAREFGVTVALENDADAAALGEVRWGSAKARGRVVFVTVGTGIGASVILDNKVYRGVGHCHPEIGHHIIDPAGPPCTCGTQGCWESWASGPALAQWARKSAPPGYDPEKITAQRICEEAEKGNSWAQQAVEHEAYYLGLGLANIVNIFAPQAILLGGSVMKSAHLFLGRIREVVRLNCRLVPHECVDLGMATLGADVGLIGAAQVWHHRFEQCGGRLV